MISASSPNVS